MWFSFLKFQIARQDEIQRSGRFGHKAAALVEDGFFEGIAGEAAIPGGAAVESLPPLVVAQQREGAALGEAVALALGEDCGDVQQFVGRVIRKLDLVREPAGKAAVGRQEGVFEAMPLRYSVHRAR